MEPGTSMGISDENDNSCARDVAADTRIELGVAGYELHARTKEGLTCCSHLGGERLLPLAGITHRGYEQHAYDRDRTDWNPGPGTPTTECLLTDRGLHQVPGEDGNDKGDHEAQGEQAVTSEPRPSLVEYEEYWPMP